MGQSTTTLPASRIRGRIRSIVEHEAGAHLTGVLLFGSRARGEERPDSDWDVAVMADRDADPMELRRRIDRALSIDGELWDEVVQVVVLRPQDMRSHSALVLSLREDAVAL